MNTTEHKYNMIYGNPELMNPFTCDVVAFDVCENRPIGYMSLHERAEDCRIICAKLNAMRRHWALMDTLHLLPVHPIKWKCQDRDDPTWHDPKTSGLPVYGVELSDLVNPVYRVLVRACDPTLAARIAYCRARQFDSYKARQYSYAVCYSGDNELTCAGIEWWGGPSESHKHWDPPV